MSSPLSCLFCRTKASLLPYALAQLGKSSHEQHLCLFLKLFGCLVKQGVDEQTHLHESMLLSRHWYTDPDSMFNGRYTFDSMSAAHDARVFASEYAVFDWGMKTIPRGNIQARKAHQQTPGRICHPAATCARKPDPEMKEITDISWVRLIPCHANRASAHALQEET